MGRETDQYMNADEYVQELLINVRSLAGEYLNWKKQSVFAGEGRIRDTEVSREGILELSQILRRGKHSFEEMHRKAEQSVRRRTVIPLEYLFHIQKAGKYLKHCVSLALAAELIVRSAVRRKESRGLHYTLDHPETRRIARDTVLPGRSA